MGHRVQGKRDFDERKNLNRVNSWRGFILKDFFQRGQQKLLLRKAQHSDLPKIVSFEILSREKHFLRINKLSIDLAFDNQEPKHQSKEIRMN
jgi:hypothetical protein